jgi:hypothetical protein
MAKERRSACLQGLLHVTSGPTPTDKRMVDVTWQDRDFEMFAIDIGERGEEVKRNFVARLEMVCNGTLPLK